MDSLPPAATIFRSPGWTACAPSAAAFESGLARGILAESGLHDVAQDGFIHLRGLEAGASNGFGDNFCAEFGSGESGEAALKFSDGRADDGKNDGSLGVHTDLRRPNNRGATNSSIARCKTGCFWTQTPTCADDRVTVGRKRAASRKAAPTASSTPQDTKGRSSPFECAEG